MDPNISLFVFGLGSFVAGMGALFWGIVKHLGQERKEGDLLLHERVNKVRDDITSVKVDVAGIKGCSECNKNINKE
jgi:hypothetical protein